MGIAASLSLLLALVLKNALEKTTLILPGIKEPLLNCLLL